MSEPITRLSELEVGKVYEMEADDVGCTITVIAPGPSPMCVIYGEYSGLGETEPMRPIVMQLVGWMMFYPDGDDTPPRVDKSFIVFDEQPESGGSILMAAHYGHGEEYIVTSIAVAPTIKELR